MTLPLILTPPLSRDARYLLFRLCSQTLVNLSRLIGDSATVTSALVPWNTCGAYMAVTLGGGTLSYLPYCFFNIANPIISILFGAFSVKIATIAVGSNKEVKVESVK